MTAEFGQPTLVLFQYQRGKVSTKIVESAEKHSHRKEILRFMPQIYRASHHMRRRKFVTHHTTLMKNFRCRILRVQDCFLSTVTSVNIITAITDRDFDLHLSNMRLIATKTRRFLNDQFQTNTI
eukprot:CCRYP_020741-RA/>CCRYP_020741-RA protein AED:0.26 eAED:0.26 QI:88/1/1/1/0/0/2/90/123